ncbi:cytochrome P450 [Hesseltinella vesiculosa]|uniref:Cytochrome P450 n=1 Tax=Hesseltinella vesiculosa TaxID=101127 RepID=A0A1X2GQQ9_9FUNG|nr:cytochrome P450 [Hesseltinella vesiculosa]
MIAQFFHNLLERIDQKNGMAHAKEGVIGLGIAIVLAGYVCKSAIKADPGIPQVPRKSLVYGNMEAYLRDPKGYLEKWHKALGPVFGDHLYGQYLVVISGQHSREIFTDDRFSFSAGLRRGFNPNLLLNTVHESVMDLSNVADVAKKYLNPYLGHYVPRAIDYFQLALEEKIGSIPDSGMVIPHVFPFIHHLVAKSSASIFIGTRLAEDNDLLGALNELMVNVNAEIAPKPWLEPFPSLMKLRMYWIGKTSPLVKRYRKQVSRVLRPEIERRMAALKQNDSSWERPDDILQRMLENYDAPPHVDTTEYVMAWLTFLIFVGVNTTTENTSLVLCRMLQHPTIADELYKEQVDVLESLGADSQQGPAVFTRDILNRMPKLDSLIRETGRAKNIYLHMPHCNTSNQTIVLSSGAVVPPGKNVIIDSYASHNDPVAQNAQDLDQFQPFRFVNQDKLATKAGEDFLFFGMGKHGCPGRWFAVQQMKIILSILIQSYHFETIDAIVLPFQERRHIPAKSSFKLIPRHKP